MKKILKILIPIVVLAALGVGGFFGYNYYTSLKGDANTTVYNENGTYSDEETLNNVVINADSVELRNKTIEGSLTIKADGSHDILLRNVAVAGDIIVEGNEQEYTLVLSNVTCRNVKISSDVPVNIEVTDSSVLSQITTDASISIREDLEGRSAGVKNVVVTGDAITVSTATDADGNEIEVVNEGDPVTINLYDTDLDGLTVSSPATVYLNGNSNVETMTTNSTTNLIDEGYVGLLTANANTTYMNGPGATVIKDGVYVRSQDEVEEANSKATEVTTETTTTTTTTTSEVAEDTTVATTTTKKTTTTAATTTTVNAKKNPPVITADAVTVTQGSTFNPLTGVTCYDDEDGVIKVKTSHITKNTVDVNTVGTYSVTYTVSDSDGNTTTKTRSVTVVADSSRLASPANLYFSYNSSGLLYLNWDKVDGAYDYTVNVNSKTVIASAPTNTANISDYISTTKSNTVSVIANPSPNSGMKDSIESSITYTFKAGTFDISDRTYVNTTTSATYEFSPFYVAEKANNHVTVLVEKYVSKKYVAVENVQVAKNKITDENGEVTITNYARGVGDLSFVFPSSGSYKITLTLDNDQDPEIILEATTDVYNTNGTISSDGAELTVDNFDFSSTSNIARRSISLQFTPSFDVYFKYGSEVAITIYYGTDKPNSEGEAMANNFVLDEYAITGVKSSSSTLSSGTMYTVKITPSTDEAEAFYDWCAETVDADEDAKIYLTGTISITASTKSSETTYTANLPILRFN